MARFRLDIEYEGTAYCGWQRQDIDQENSARGSIQAAIEEAIYSYCQENINLTVAGRTDAGVHALHQVAHFDLNKEPKKGAVEIANALNNFLLIKQHNISILNCQQVNKDFSARFSAQNRRYLYRITIRKAPLALDKLRAWHIKHPLNIDKMKEAANYLCGKHDFSSFRSSQCQAKNPCRSVTSFSFKTQAEELFIEVSAPSFLHNQVRAMVGTLYNIGRGFWAPEYIKTIIAAKDRNKAGPNAPAHGLYLYRIEY